MQHLFRNSQFWLILIIVVCIFTACLMMNGPMRDGLPVNPDFMQRMQYIQANIHLWQSGWLLWMFSALGLFTFCAILADTFPASTYKKIGLSFVMLGIAPDLSAEVIYAFIMPAVYAANSSAESLFILDKTAMFLTGFLGNGLYNLGGIILNLLLYKTKKLPAWAIWWGLTSWLTGLLLSAAIACNDIKLAELMTIFSMTSNTLWMLIFAYFGLKQC